MQVHWRSFLLEKEGKGGGNKGKSYRNWSLGEGWAAVSVNWESLMGREECRYSLGGVSQPLHWREVCSGWGEDEGRGKFCLHVG